jgi:hypothetical protein
MGAEAKKEEGEERVARTLVSPVRSFVRSTLEAAEEDLVEVVRFVDNVVEGALKSDPKLVEYIREFGEGVRLRAYRLLASLVVGRKAADEFLDDVANDIAEVLKAKRQKTG